MKIVQTPARFPPYIGGVENYVYNLSRELAESGQQVKVICADDPAGLAWETGDVFKLKKLSYVFKIANTNITPKLPFALFKEDFDIIHTHLPTPWSADWSALIARIKGKPLVVTYHNDIVGQGGARYLARLYNLTSLEAILDTASCIVITQPNYLKASPYLKGFADKVKVIPNGVDTNRFKPEKSLKAKGNTIFFLGLLDRFHKYKGLDYLLEAMVTVKDHIADIKLMVGGDGELLEYYKNRTNLLGLAENVEFSGFIPEEKLIDYFNLCDIFILPSISAEQEGFGIVLLEAMACEKPVIGTDIVGVADDVIARCAGKIVRPKDAKALSGAIVEILMDKELAEEMGERGRKLVKERYTWKRAGRDMLRLYEELT